MLSLCIKWGAFIGCRVRTETVVRGEGTHTGIKTGLLPVTQPAILLFGLDSIKLVLCASDALLPWPTHLCNSKWKRRRRQRLEKPVDLCPYSRPSKFFPKSNPGLLELNMLTLENYLALLW